MPVQGILVSMAHICECGAVYEVESRRSPVPDTDTATCQVCKREMDRWHHSTTYRVYKLVKRPETDTD